MHRIQSKLCGVGDPTGPDWGRAGRMVCCPSLWWVSKDSAGAIHRTNPRRPWVFLGRLWGWSASEPGILSAKDVGNIWVLFERYGSLKVRRWKERWIASLNSPHFLTQGRKKSGGGGSGWGSLWESSRPKPAVNRALRFLLLFPPICTQPELYRVIRPGFTPDWKNRWPCAGKVEYPVWKSGESSGSHSEAQSGRQVSALLELACRDLVRLTRS